MLHLNKLLQVSKHFKSKHLKIFAISTVAICSLFLIFQSCGPAPADFGSIPSHQISGEDQYSNHGVGQSPEQGEQNVRASDSPTPTSSTNGTPSNTNPIRITRTFTRNITIRFTGRNGSQTPSEENTPQNSPEVSEAQTPSEENSPENSQEVSETQAQSGPCSYTSGEDLSGAEMAGDDLSGRNLRNADLSDADLQDCKPHSGGYESHETVWCELC